MAEFPNLDEIDRLIIAALQSDARQTNRALAEKVGVAPSTSLERVRLLEQRGVIRGYHADVDPAALGLGLQAMVAIRLQPKKQAVITEATDRLWAIPEVIAVNLLSGVDDLIVRVCASDADHLRRLIVDGISAIPGVAEERTSLLFAFRQKFVVRPVATG